MTESINMPALGHPRVFGFKAFWKDLSILGKLIVSIIAPVCVIGFAGIGIVGDFSELDKNKKQGNADNNYAREYLNQLNYHISSGSQSLGFYLLSKEEYHKKKYIESMSLLDQFVNKLKSDISDEYYKIHGFEKIHESIAGITKHKDNFLNLAVNNADNYPAIRYASESVNTKAQKISQLIELMVDAEANEGVSSERKKLVFIINDMRLSWNKLLGELRFYLAFRTKSTVQNIGYYRENIDTRLNEIAELEDLLNLEQMDAAEQLFPLFKAYYKDVDKLIIMHNSDKWRIDAYIIRDQYGPELQHIKQLINDHIAKQNSLVWKISG